MLKTKKSPVKKKTKKKKANTKYQLDGYSFISKQEKELYMLLKSSKKNKLISHFEVPGTEGINKGKGRSKKCIIDNHIFDSRMEGKFYIKLLNEKNQGEIKKIDLHPKYTLLESFKKYGKTIRAMTYTGDFLVEYGSGEKILYDVKGYKTEAFKIKQKLFDSKFSDINLQCITHKAKNDEWVLV